VSPRRGGRAVLIGVAPAALAWLLALAWLVALGRPPLPPLAAAQAAAQAAAPPGAGITADDIAVDSSGTTVIATGHVSVTYGSLHATSDALRVVRPTGTATFAGHVAMTDGERRATAETATVTVVGESRVTGLALAGRASVASAGYHLLADRIAADRQSGLSGRLAAAGHVTLTARPDIIVTGAVATYDQAADLAVVRGDAARPAAFRNRDGRVAGAVLEFRRKTGDVEVRGPVTGRVYDAALQADEASVHLGDGTAVLRGHVRVVRGQGTLRADRLTVYYRARRFVAEGETHLSFTDAGEP
jgi:lipopolysaccharide export system protein LptA